jgi:hypothetical protein
MMGPVSFFFFLPGKRGFVDNVDCCEAEGPSSASILKGELVGWTWLEALKDVAGVTGRLENSGMVG